MGSSVQARTMRQGRARFPCGRPRGIQAHDRGLDDDRLGSARSGIVGDVRIGYSVAGSARAPDLDELSGQSRRTTAGRRRCREARPCRRGGRATILSTVRGELSMRSACQLEPMCTEQSGAAAWPECVVARRNCPSKTQCRATRSPADSSKVNVRVICERTDGMNRDPWAMHWPRNHSSTRSAAFDIGYPSEPVSSEVAFEARLGCRWLTKNSVWSATSCSNASPR